MNFFKSWAFLLVAPLVGMAGLAGMIITQSAPPPASQPAISQAALLTAPSSFRAPQIQQFLEQKGSPLSAYQELVGDQPLPASDLFWLASQSENYGINPKALLTTFYLENNALAWPQNGGLLAHLQEIASRLAALEAESYAAPAADAKLLPDPESNSATAALARYLAPQAKLTGQVRASVQSWAQAYTALFGESPQTKSAEAPPATVPFLRLPFDQPLDNFFKVESFFDHYTPGNFGEPGLSRFDGKVLPGAPFKTCWDGVTCYSGHNALDYKMPSGTPLYTAAAGQVILRYDYEGGLIIDHGNGYRTLYWHLDKILVNLNQQVAEGQQIGFSGNRGPSTGPHLHFGLRLSALSRDVDPYGWWTTTRDPWPYPSRWLWRGGLTADNGTAQSQLFYVMNWERDARGFGGDSYYTYSTSSFGASTNWGVWGAYIQTAGIYTVYAYWPKTPENTTSAIYQVWNAKGVSSISLSQRQDGDRWVPLGTFEFKQGPTAVLLTDQTRDNPNHQRVYFDAIKWVPAGGTYYIPAVPNGSGASPSQP